MSQPTGRPPAIPLAERIEIALRENRATWWQTPARLDYAADVVLTVVQPELDRMAARIAQLEAAQGLTAAALLDAAAPRPAATLHPHAAEASAALEEQVRCGRLTAPDCIGPDMSGRRSVVVRLTPTGLYVWRKWCLAVHADPDGVTHRGSFTTALGSYCGVPVTLVGHGVGQLLAAAVTAQGGAR